MAARGGRGGGRGGRGGRGGAGGPGGAAQMPIGQLLYADIIAHSKLEAGVLYPPAPECDTDFPSPDEQRIARTISRINNEMRLNSTFHLAAPSATQAELEKYSDRFKLGRSKDLPTLKEWHKHRTVALDLLPSSVVEAVWTEKTNKKRAERDVQGNPRSSKKSKIAAELMKEEEDAEEAVAGSDISGNSDDDDEQLDGLEDDEDDDGGNEYEDNYFDNGEGDDGDMLGVGGGGGDDVPIDWPMALCLVDNGRQTPSTSILDLDIDLDLEQHGVPSPSCSSDGDHSVMFVAKHPPLQQGTTTTMTTSQPGSDEDAASSSTSSSSCLGSVLFQGRKRSARFSRRDTVVVLQDVAISLDASSSSSPSNLQSTTSEQRSSPLSVSSPLCPTSTLVCATPHQAPLPLKPTRPSKTTLRPSSPFPPPHSNPNNQENSPTQRPFSPRSRPPTPLNLHLASSFRPGSPLRFATAGVGSRPSTPSALRSFLPAEEASPVVQDEDHLQRMLKVVVNEGRMALASEVGPLIDEGIGPYEEEQLHAFVQYDDTIAYAEFGEEAIEEPYMIENNAAAEENAEEALPPMPYVTMRDLHPPAAALELLRTTTTTDDDVFSHPRRAIDYDDDDLTDTDSPWEVDEVSFGAGTIREGEGMELDDGILKRFEEFGVGKKEDEGEGEEVEEGHEETEEDDDPEQSDELGEKQEAAKDVDEDEEEQEAEYEPEAERDDSDVFDPVGEPQQLAAPLEEAGNADEDEVAEDHETEQEEEEEEEEGTPETSAPSSPSGTPKIEVDAEAQCDDLPEESVERAVPEAFRPGHNPKPSSASPTEEQQDTEEDTAISEVIATPTCRSPAPPPTKTPFLPAVDKQQLATVTAAPIARRRLVRPREIFKPVTKPTHAKSRLGGASSSAVSEPQSMLAGPSTSAQVSTIAKTSAVPSTSSSPMSKKPTSKFSKSIPVPAATARPVVARKIASPTRLVKAKVPIPLSTATVQSIRLPSAKTKFVAKHAVPKPKSDVSEVPAHASSTSSIAATAAPASPRRSPRKPSPPAEHVARSNSSASASSSSSTAAAPTAATRLRVMAAPGASANRVAAAAARRAAAATAANEIAAKKPPVRPATTTTALRAVPTTATDVRVKASSSAISVSRPPLARPGSRIVSGPSTSSIAAASLRRPASALSTASTASSVEAVVHPTVVPVAVAPTPATPVAALPTPVLPLLPRPPPIASTVPRSPEKKAQRVKDNVVTTKVDLENPRPPSALGTSSRGLGLAKTPSLASVGSSSPIRTKLQLLPPPVPLPRTGLVGLAPTATASTDSILTAPVESLNSLASAVAAKDVFAPLAPTRELLPPPPPLPRPTRQSKFAVEDRFAPATPVAETALLPRPVRRKKPSIDATEALGEPITPRPVLSFQPAPVLTQDELSRLTQRNTKKNQLHFNHHQIVVHHLEVPRPPSPTSKIRKSIGGHGVSGATSAGREARAAKRRNALRSSTDGTELDLLYAELEAAGPFASGVGMVEQLKTHYRAPGDDEEYSSPVRSSTSSRKRGSGGANKKSSVGAAPARRVKWDKALVYEGPLKAQQEVKVDGILKSKAPLDSFGNLTVIGGSLGKAVPVQIKKLIYIDDPPE
ncbi:BQ2448_2259 [Microbotryum intermedium]|uniref:BQ2448_2259 protein n=1 Tax=Microbotryum intermedium TaxID=269621 RepID=A0A238F901_9BASI|nr:BQ2448_2259 [Microbotryum intermedium]